MNKNVFIILCLMLSVCGNMQAQKVKNFISKGDSLLSVRYHRGKFDTAYIMRPKTKLTLTGRFNVSGSAIELWGKDAGADFHSQVTSDWKTTLSVGVNYMGVGIFLAVNPAKMMGKYKDLELNFTSYGNRWGFDIAYQNAKYFNGWYEESGKGRMGIPNDMLSMKTLNVNAYYAFNHRKFSYPAAFSQTYIQRRSAGSFLLGLSGQAQWTKTKGDFESFLRGLNVGVGAGYGYNWVPGRRWLLHLSTIPTVIVFSRSWVNVNGERSPIRYHFPSFIVPTRAAVVYQFGRCFVGTSAVFNFTNIGDKDKLAVDNYKWLTRLFFGYRL